MAHRLVASLLSIIVLLALLPESAAAQGVEDAIYRLGTGDRLRVTVFDEPDLSGQFEISVGGVVSLPLIGEVQATGVSLNELEHAIEAKLLDGFLKHPRVSLEVLNYRPFYILGEVNRPGGYPYVAGMTILNAVALAGGYTYRARKGRIKLQRAEAAEAEGDYVEESGIVLPGDIITVEERFF